MIRERERELAAAQTRLAKAEVMLTAGTVVDGYWEAQREQALADVEDGIASVAFRRRCMLEDLLQAA